MKTKQTKVQQIVSTSTPLMTSHQWTMLKSLLKNASDTYTYHQKEIELLCNCFDDLAFGIDLY